ncbi:hypothetical protein, partial [Pseudomonas cichorii]|uniref:hypothetical protein n=1 Tax=Pseudomonas cichorii TaxID=36746 RepID=UPI001F20C959
AVDGLGDAAVEGVVFVAGDSKAEVPILPVDLKKVQEHADAAVLHKHIVLRISKNFRWCDSI